VASCQRWRDPQRSPRQPYPALPARAVQCHWKGEGLSIRCYLADLDCRVSDLGALDQALAQRVLFDKRVERLVTISGIHVTVALGLLAAINDIKRFA
jgi:hypothetical protein